MSEFVRVAKSTLLQLLDRMIIKAGSKHMLLKQIKKTFNRDPEVLSKYHTMASDIVSNIAPTEINTRGVSDSRRAEKTSSVFAK